MIEKKLVQWFWWLLGRTSSQVSLTLLVFIVVLLVTMVFIQWWKYRNLPPGPWGFPIVGYLPFIKSPMHLLFKKWAKKYGPVNSVRFGVYPTVIINDPKIIRKEFARREFSGRPHTDFMNIIDGYGIVNTEGDLWKEQRKFLFRKLKPKSAVNGGIITINRRIMIETKLFLQELEKRREVPTDISSLLAVPISNVICSLTMSKTFSYDDLTFQRFMKLIDEGFELFAKLTYPNYIPMLRNIYSWFPKLFNKFNDTRNKLEKNRAEMAQFFQLIIEEHRESYIEGRNDDIIDAYLHEIQQAIIEGRDLELYQGKNKDRQMQQIMGDLFSAGMETVKTSLEWSVVYMLNYPEAAEAVQNELDQFVGMRLPSHEDLPRLVKTRATINEILRRTSIVPLGTTHATTEDVKMESTDYTLPAGTHVIPNIYAVHMNPEYWDEPEAFRPSRFISDDGTIFEPEYFMPFGVGRRRCLGEKMAELELFLFFSSLMHTFHLRLPEGAPLPSLEGRSGITISPEPFKVCLLPRNRDIDLGNGFLRNIGSN